MIILALSAMVVIMGLLLYRQRHKKDNPDSKWACKEGNCEVDINGNFDSKSDCLQACKRAWACTSNYQCVKSDQGFTSKDLCEQNCSAPATLGVPSYYYYPQSLYYYRRPRYWRYHRGRPGRRGGRHGHKK